MTTDPRYQPPKRTFSRCQIYSDMQIRIESHEYDEPRDYDGTVYLIARAFDGREYWFSEKGDGWQVDHTWSSFQLTKGESE